MRRGNPRPTAKCHLRNDKQVQAVQVVGISSGEDGIGATQVAVDIADLRRKLQAPNPHLGLSLASCGLSVKCSGSDWPCLSATRGEAVSKCR